MVSLMTMSVGAGTLGVKAAQIWIWLRNIEYSHLTIWYFLFV
jgi:hypothetical protein